MISMIICYFVSMRFPSCNVQNLIVQTVVKERAIFCHIAVVSVGVEKRAITEVGRLKTVPQLLVRVCVMD